VSQLKENTGNFYDQKWRGWEEMIRWSPAPRIRREKIISWVKKLAIKSLLDVGCGNGQFLLQIRSAFKDLDLYGADICGQTLADNRKFMPQVQFLELDLNKTTLLRKFDLVICMETLEHIDDWQKALENLISMAGKYLIITLPCGPLFTIDRLCAHKKHFKAQEISDKIISMGFKISRIEAWGFPFFNLYKHLINLSPGASTREFLDNKKYNLFHKAVSFLTYILLKLSLPFWGYQLFVMAER
jgi:SAM-dependent methyltransferase